MTHLIVLLSTDTLVALALAYYQHKAYGYSFVKHFFQVWFGLSALSLLILKFFY